MRVGGKFKSKVTRYSVVALVGLIALALVVITFNPFLTASPVRSASQQSAPHSTASGTTNSSLLSSPATTQHHHESDDGISSDGSGNSVYNIDD